MTVAAHLKPSPPSIDAHAAAALPAYHPHEATGWLVLGGETAVSCAMERLHVPRGSPLVEGPRHGEPARRWGVGQTSSRSTAASTPSEDGATSVRPARDRVRSTVPCPDGPSTRG